MKLLVMQFILSPVTSYLLGPNTIVSTLFLHTPTVCSSLNMRDQVCLYSKMPILLFLWGKHKNGVNWETRLIYSKKMWGCYMLEDNGKQLKMWTLEHFYNVVTTWSLFLTKYYSGDEIKCSMYGGQESCIQGFGRET